MLLKDLDLFYTCFNSMYHQFYFAKNQFDTNYFLGIVMVSANEALATLIRLDLSQRQYQALRNLMKTCNAIILPPYKKLLAAKKECIPPGMKVEPGKGIISFEIQSVLDHFMRRMVSDEKMRESILSYEDIPDVILTLWAKYGSDSATTHSQYQTKDKINHQSIFTTFLVPVCLQVTWTAQNKKPVNLFLNPMANSAFGCFYLRVAFEKEDKGKSQFIEKGAGVAFFVI